MLSLFGCIGLCYSFDLTQNSLKQSTVFPNLVLEFRLFTLDFGIQLRVDFDINLIIYFTYTIMLKTFYKFEQC